MIIIILIVMIINMSLGENLLGAEENVASKKDDLDKCLGVVKYFNLLNL